MREMRGVRGRGGKGMEKGFDVDMIYMRQAFIWPRGKGRRGKGVDTVDVLDEGLRRDME